jgi:uncharacterized protein YacL (UPF0231 family)
VRYSDRKYATDLCGVTDFVDFVEAWRLFAIHAME